MKRAAPAEPDRPPSSHALVATLALLAFAGLVLLAPSALAEEPGKPVTHADADPLGDPVACHDTGLEHGAGTPTSGCLMWDRQAPGDAVTAVPGEASVLAAGIRGETLEVRRLDPATGHERWTQSLSLDEHHDDVSIEVDAPRERVYVGWDTYDRRGFDEYANFEQGGVARLDLDTGTVAWSRQGGTSGLAVAPDGDHVYYGISEPGHEYWDGWGREHDPAALRVHAVDTADGERAWTTSTSLWWTAHRAGQVDRTSSLYCYAGPAEVIVAPDGTVFAANDPRCDVGATLLALQPSGSLAYVKSLPQPLGASAPNECSGCRSYRDAALAMHPAGHTVYAAWSEYLAAYDVASGDKRWDVRGNHLADPCPTEDRGVNCADPLTHVPGGRTSDPGVDGFGKALAVTSGGQVVWSGFARPSYEERMVRPWVSIFDADTGYWLAGAEDVQTEDSLMEASSRPELESEVEVADGGHTFYVAFRADGDARAFGYLFTGDALWGYQEPVWEARTPSGDPADWAANLAPTGEGIVVGDGNLSGHSPSHLLSHVERVASSDTLDQEEVDAAKRDTQQTTTRALHGDRVAQGTPTVLVEADGTLRAEVNITEPGVYYVLVENVTGGQEYAFQDPSWMSGQLTPVSFECPGGGAMPWVQGPDNCPVYDPQSKERICSSDVPWFSGARFAEGNCYGRSREDPVTVTRADYAAGREVDNGSALFGPVVLTEGRYAVFEREDGQGALESATTKGLEAISRCTSDDVVSSHDARLVECLEVHVRTDGGEGTEPMEGSPDPFRSSGHTMDRSCRYETSNRFFSWDSTTDANRTSSEESRIYVSSMWILGTAVERYPDGDHCRVNIGQGMGQASLALFGKTDFHWDAEWTVTFSLGGVCNRNGQPVECRSGDWDTRLELATPTSCLPDQETLYVAGLLEEPGTTAAERQRSEASAGFFDSLIEGLRLKPLFNAARHGVDWLGHKEDDWIPIDCEMDKMHECGAGCQEWAWRVDEDEKFIHRYAMRVGACGETGYPTSWGIEAANLHFDADRHPMQAWTHEPSLVNRSIPVELTRWDCAPS